MGDDPRERPPRWHKSWGRRLVNGRKTVWSWLTDPAVLVYRRAAHGQRRARVLTVEFFLFVREVTREFWNIDGPEKAAALAYTSLLSLIPLMVAFTEVLGKSFKRIFPGFHSDFDQVLNTLIPYQSSQISNQLGRFSDNAATASTFGLIIFLVISFRLFLAVEATVNQIWKVRSSRAYRVKIRSFTMLFFWGPLLMGLSLTTNQSLQRNPYLRLLFKGDIVFTIVPIVLLFIAFTMLFWLVPSTRVKFSSAAVGALVTTSLFSLVRWGFGIYANYLFEGRFNVIYGTVGLILIFLIAIQVMWTVILLGVEISFVYQNLYGILRASEQQIEDEPRFDMYYALRALVEIARRFERREEAPSSYRLAEQFGTPDPQMVRVLRRLEDGKLVNQIGGEWTGFVPGCDPDRITVEEVIAQMEGVRRAVPDVDPSERERAAIGDLFARIHNSAGDALNRMSIGHLVRELYAPRVARAEDRGTGT